MSVSFALNAVKAAGRQMAVQHVPVSAAWVLHRLPVWPKTDTLTIPCHFHSCYLSVVHHLQRCAPAQEYAGCLPQEAAASPGSLGAWLYSCVGVSHGEEAALRVNLPSLTVQVSQDAAHIHS